MQLELIKKIVQTQKEEIEEELGKEKIIVRKGAAHVKPFLAHPNILAILGVRRCGKSIFSLILSQNLKEKLGYLNFHDERLIPFETEDFDKVLQVFYELYGTVDLIILDEVQEVKNWEKFVSRLRKTKKVIITGSNSKLLSGELATYLTGRHLDFVLYPFSFEEFLDFKPDFYSTKDAARARAELEKYLAGSGFPEYKKFGKVILKTIYDDIITKDCLRRHPIREEAAFRKLAYYLISNFSREFSYSKLSRILEIKDVQTVSNYVNYLQESFLLLVLERYSPKLKQQIIAPKKAYVVDHGLSNFVSFNTGRNQGRLFENVVLIELMRRKSFGDDFECFYYKDHQGREVDFVIKEKRRTKQLIQVCCDLSNEETKERELDSLMRAAKELKCRNLLVITDDYSAEEKVEGKKVKFIPLWKWLLKW